MRENKARRKNTINLATKMETFSSSKTFIENTKKWKANTQEEIAFVVDKTIDK